MCEVLLQGSADNSWFRTPDSVLFYICLYSLRKIFQGWEETEYQVTECRAEEHFCIEFLSTSEKETLRDCWNPAYYNKYNYTGCQAEIA